MIVIPNKNQKRASLIVDALRILAWQQYKIDNQASGLEGYEQFSTEWKACDIHQKELKSLLKFISDLGYTEEELLQERKRYYDQKKKLNGNVSGIENGNGNGKDDYDSEPPY